MNTGVLVVDDEVPIHRFLKPALIASGFDVLSALTGQQALRLIDTAPDIMLLDLVWPIWTARRLLPTSDNFLKFQ